MQLYSHSGSSSKLFYLQWFSKMIDTSSDSTKALQDAQSLKTKSAWFSTEQGGKKNSTLIERTGEATR